MTYKIQFKVDTAANYASVNPTLAMGEVGYISDLQTIKIGNGVDAWNDLAFPTGFTGTDSAAVHLTVGGEIAGITEKVTPADADKILIEDSADDDKKKYIQIGSLPGGSGSYTDEQAQDAIGTILADSSTIDFTYNDATPSIIASVIQSAINTSSITNGAGFITSSGVTYEALNSNSDVGTGATQVAAGNHAHTGTYEPADANIRKTTSVITEFVSGLIESPANGDYVILRQAPFAGTITSVTTKSSSGTCTLTGYVNSTALGGTANSVSSTEQEQSHSSSNTFAAGDDIKITVSSNSSCEDMEFTIKYTRALV